MHIQFSLSLKYVSTSLVQKAITKLSCHNLQNSLSLMYISKRLAKIDINIVNLNTTHVLVQVHQYPVIQYLLQ